MIDLEGHNTDQKIYAVWHTNLPNEEATTGGILILADMGVTFQGLLKAVQQCFPNVAVELSNRLPEAGVAALPPRIVLVHASGLWNTSAVVARCKDRFPGATIALMADTNWADIPGLRALVVDKQVQGVLPFNMHINAWLATVWLLLNGGEYFPNMPAARTWSSGAAPTRGGNAADGTERGTHKPLSAREDEVLELLSQGLQNKLIAAKMDLSEHTVKVHVHNIIRKLKVHNRTQAAAVFRTLDRRRPGDQMDGAESMRWLESGGVY
jgi:DNA-binding NarL/FixJ family response regulator